MQKLDKTPNFSTSFKINSKNSDAEDQSNYFSSMPKSFSFNLSLVKDQAARQNEEKLENLKQKLLQLNANCYIEKLKINEQFYTAELENSMIKNEILNLESQIIESKGLLYSVGKGRVDKEKECVKELRSGLRREEEFSGVENCVILKNVGSNLQYLQEKIEIMQDKSLKSQMKLERSRSDYDRRISKMNSELKSIQNRIENLETEHFQLSCTLRELQNKNKSLSSALSSKSSRLKSLKQKSQDLFLKYSNLRSKINKKPKY